MSKRNFNGAYKDEFLNRVAFPMGGIGAGMICLEGTGAFSHVSLRHKPDVFNEPYLYAALCLKGVDGGSNVARVLEGPVPSWKLFGTAGAGNGLHTRTYGLPRFASATFRQGADPAAMMPRWARLFAMRATRGLSTPMERSSTRMSM